MTEIMKVFDLFAGAGGFSLGFKQAGAETIGMLEVDGWACKTLRHNFGDEKVIEADINNFDVNDFQKNLKDQLDVIIGGPPCQGYSLCRRGKGEPNDPRNKLVFDYLRIVNETRPKVFIMENVANLAKSKNQDGHFVRDVLREEIENLGYNFYIKVLSAADYGVPQTRHRCFIIGSERSLNDAYPKPTHSLIPKSDLIETFQKTPTLWDAISDLPVLQAGQGGEETEYSNGVHTDFQKSMRANNDVLFNHKAMNHSKRMVERFESMSCGQSVSDVPHHLRPRKRNTEEISEYLYDQNNRRLYPDKPSNTIPASFYANFVHPFQHRNFTAREGARIQSFPDHYKFLGKPTLVSKKLLEREGRTDELYLCQYNQIGNAVPPMLAKKIAEHIKEQINGSSR